ncbi:hypothetical protein AK812_SmicGene3264 [Symbiodinium microadriaticum]|uniref:Uncharacterized protein n=1 Tax=Symbiodinium microadriaticum TaxID=2951 RepID=A0A1Q9EZ58_SYMMI|nr:hypothetical protein AK812_SmicGene3264 [Symbiodinium microadriaticum]
MRECMSCFMITEIVQNFELVISVLVKLELDFPSPGVFKDAFLKINSDRGLLVLGTAKKEPGLGGYTGRMFAGYVGIVCTHDQENQVREVPGFTSESLGDSLEGDNEAADAVEASPGAVPEACPEAASDSQVPPPSPEAPAEDTHLGEVLHAQLQQMNCDDGLDVLQQQTRQKRQAREQKAAKMLAKGQGKGGRGGRGKKGTSDVVADKGKPCEGDDANEGKPCEGDDANEGKPRGEGNDADEGEPGGGGNDADEGKPGEGNDADEGKPGEPGKEEPPAKKQKTNKEDLMMLEAFSGVGRVAAAFQESGSTYDTQKSPIEENILSTIGFLNLLKKTLKWLGGIRNTMTKEEERGPELALPAMLEAVKSLVS